MKIEDILVPIDFSPGSLRALDYALAMVDPSGEVYLLHVIDADFLARVSDEGFCDAETARAQMQSKAEERLHKIAQKFSLLNVRIESMVVVGKPFAEILRIAADLHFSLIRLNRSCGFFPYQFVIFPNTIGLSIARQGFLRGTNIALKFCRRASAIMRRENI